MTTNHEETQTNEQQKVAESTYRTANVKFTDAFMDLVDRQFYGNEMPYTNYQKQCVFNALTAIYKLLEAKEINVNNPKLDRSTITDCAMKVALLELNPLAMPREVFFRTRRVKLNGNWITKVELDIEGDGNEILVARYGRDVRTVHNYWVVRENDVFEYPKYRGIDISPPIWEPRGTGKAIRVIYPITKTNGITEYHIAERMDVLKNLVAHVRNNLQSETFDITKNKYDATPEELEQIEQQKNEILNRILEIGLDATLENMEPMYANFISPAWRDPVSMDAMVVRKMRNNILKKITKDFSNPYAQRQYHEINTFRRDITPAQQSEVVDTSTGEISHEGNTYTPHVEHPNFVDKQQDEAAFPDA